MAGRVLSTLLSLRRKNSLAFSGILRDGDSLLLNAVELSGQRAVPAAALSVLVNQC